MTAALLPPGARQTISEFEKEIELLQMQKIDVEKLVQSQKREMRGDSAGWLRLGTDGHGGVTGLQRSSVLGWESRVGCPGV